MPRRKKDEHARDALLAYMLWSSEERWAAGWMTGLHLSLLGDKAYEWLVDEAGGWWTSDTRFQTGTLDRLRSLAISVNRR